MCKWSYTRHSKISMTEAFDTKQNKNITVVKMWRRISETWYNEYLIDTEAITTALGVYVQYYKSLDGFPDPLMVRIMSVLDSRSNTNSNALNSRSVPKAFGSALLIKLVSTSEHAARQWGNISYFILMPLPSVSPWCFNWRMGRVNKTVVFNTLSGWFYRRVSWHLKRSHQQAFFSALDAMSHITGWSFIRSSRKFVAKWDYFICYNESRHAYRPPTVIYSPADAFCTWKWGKKWKMHFNLIG